MKWESTAGEREGRRRDEGKEGKPPVLILWFLVWMTERRSVNPSHFPENEWRLDCLPELADVMVTTLAPGGVI